MSTSIVALFDTSTQAQTAVRRLIDAGLPSSKISVIAKNDQGNTTRSTVDTEGNLAAEGAASGITSGSLVGGAIGLLAGLGLGVAVPFLGFLVAGPVAGLITGAVAGAATGGILGGLIGLGIPKDEAEVYAQGVEKGGTLVIAEVDDAHVSRYEDILDGEGAKDVHEEAGYAPATVAAPAGSYTSTPLAADTTYASTTATTPIPAIPATPSYATPANTFDDAKDGDRLEVVEEQLSVGKREVERGGVRVRRYVTERPVSEQINLREEHVNVERRPVDRPASTIGDDAFAERTFEVRETAEVPVVAKEARVVEEVLVGKTVENRTETVSDAVRRVDVDIEQLGKSFQEDFDARYAGQNASFADYEPSYRYGAGISRDSRFDGRDWSTFESDVRSDYEAKNPGKSFDRAKDAIKAGYDKARGNYAYADQDKTTGSF